MSGQADDGRLGGVRAKHPALTPLQPVDRVIGHLAHGRPDVGMVSRHPAQGRVAIRADQCAGGAVVGACHASGSRLRVDDGDSLEH